MLTSGENRVSKKSPLALALLIGVLIATPVVLAIAFGRHVEFAVEHGDSKIDLKIHGVLPYETR